MDEPNGATRGRTEPKYPAIAGDALTSALRADLGQRARGSKSSEPKPDLAAGKITRESEARMRSRFALSPESAARTLDAVDGARAEGEASTTATGADFESRRVEASMRAVDFGSRGDVDSTTRSIELERARSVDSPVLPSVDPRDRRDAETTELHAIESRSGAREPQVEAEQRIEARVPATPSGPAFPRAIAHERAESGRPALELRDASPIVRASARTVALARERAQSGSPTIGVVVPTLDEERLLPLLLDRLFDRAGDHDPLDRADEVVVADGESRDRTREIARERGATVVRACASRGVQLATGAHASSADVFLFLHADCVPRRGAIARIRRAFEDESVLATAMHQEIESAGLLYRCIERCADLRSRLGLVWGDSGLAVRRDAYEEVGGFGPFEIFEDVDLSLRLRRAGRIRFLSDATLGVSARRWHSEGALRCTLRNWELCARFFLGADPNALARSYRKCAAV